MKLYQAVVPVVIFVCQLIGFGLAAEAADTVRIDWNPRIGEPGSSDPLVGQTTDPTLGLAGDLTQVGLTRNPAGTFSVAFFDVPSTFSENHYMEFSVIPADGRSLDVGDLIIQTAANLSQMTLRTSLDGFTLDYLPQNGPSSLNNPTSPAYPRVFELSSLPILTSRTTFRIYPFGISGGVFGYAGSVSVPGRGLWFSDILSEPLPEPASLSLLGLGAMALLRHRQA